ncbi:MAG: cytochrome P450 [Acidimicrobiaceae bacterium]|jgi:cytochrome P450|nr:cytochrome P450 [Acidimicrobiaceae bacterium]
MTISKADLDTAIITSEAYGEQSFPFEEWRWLRANDPIHWTDVDKLENFWAITRHRHITEISSQPEVFSNEAGNIVIFREEQAATFDREDNPFNSMRVIIQMDPPDHREFRNVASGFFTPRGITRLDEIVTNTARMVIDRLSEHGSEPVDFVAEVAQRHPLRVLCTILGVPPEDEDRLLELTSQLFAFDDPDLGPPGEDRQAAADLLGLQFYDLFNVIIEERRENPRDDLASLLANAQLKNGEPMGLIETLGYYLIVFNAGHDTTRHSLSGAIGAFLEHPEEFARLKKDPSLLKTAVDEIVRYTAPVNYMKRTAMQDYQLDDTLIKKGDRLCMFYGAANRDEEIFDDPDRFDVGREHNRHLGFGWAEHYCLGAHLAKASISALLEQMIERIESMEPAAEPTYTASSFVHGYKTLPVKVNWT